MRKKRDITINVIKNDIVNIRRLARFFAEKYTEQSKEDIKNKKS